MNWKAEIINVLVIAVTGALLGYFFNKKLENVKKEAAIYLMKYQTLNLKRVEAIEEIYSKLEKAIRYMSESINQLQNVNDSIQLKRIKEAQKLAQDFKETYSGKKIYLTSELAEMLVSIDAKMMTNWSKFIRSNSITNNTNQDFKKWDEAWIAFTEQEIPAIFKELEKEFREQLGITMFVNK